MKSDCPIQTARHTIKHHDFNPSSTRMVSWSKEKINKIKRTLRRVNKSFKSMKARKSKTNEIDRCHEISNDDQDCTRIDKEEGNEDLETW